MLFIDYSSAFNAIVPSKLIIRLGALCNRSPGLPDGPPPKVGNTTLILNTEAPQGCVLSPLLYSLFTHDCLATHASNSIIKFEDAPTVVGLITNNDETAYMEEVRALAEWCQESNLSLNINKMKEQIVDFRETAEGARPYSHRQGHSGEGEELQVPRRPHHGQTEMVHPHRQRGEEDASTPLQPQEAEEIWLGP